MNALVAAVGCSAALALAASGGVPRLQAGGGRAAAMDDIAERYVKLVLAIGRHDADYVDAYYGPEAWKTEAEAAKPPLDALGARARALLGDLAGIPVPNGQIEQLRAAYLERQLAAAAARVRMLAGERLPFDEESRALYDAVAPSLPEAHFQKVLDALEREFPGEGTLLSRYDAFRREFVVPEARLDTVFQAAIKGCRDRTAAHIPLPADERFTLEYVTGKSWSGYNWYRGNYRSLIQLNTDLPVHIDRALDLACHEGYPGHHVYNVLLEQHLVRGRGWVEFSVLPLFSPQALIAEGTANYGIEVAFPGPERLAFERTVLFPAAGLDPARAGEYYRIKELVDELAYAGNEAARRYLNGEINQTDAAAWLERYALMTPERAAQRVRFFDQYRSYVINYNLGKDLVAAFIDTRPEVAAGPAARWQAFAALLSSPRLPSTLK